MIEKKTYTCEEALGIILASMIKEGQEPTAKDVARIIAELTGGTVIMLDEKTDAA